MKRNSAVMQTECKQNAGCLLIQLHQCLGIADGGRCAVSQVGTIEQQVHNLQVLNLFLKLVSKNRPLTIIAVSLKNVRHRSVRLGNQHTMQCCALEKHALGQRLPAMGMQPGLMQILVLHTTSRN